MKKLDENFRLRVLSVLIAIILWIFVLNVQTSDIKGQITGVPVNVINTDSLIEQGLVLAEIPSITTTVKVKGDKEIIRSLEKKDIEAVADLKGYNKPGRVSIPLRLNVLGKQGVKVLESNPKKIELNIEKLVSIEKRVEVVFKGKQEDDNRFVVKGIKPNFITISGPESLVNSIESVKVFIDIPNKEKDFSIFKNYRIFNKAGLDITDKKGLIKYNQGIQVEVACLKSKEVSVIPKLIGQVREGYYISQITVEPSRINIIGLPERIKTINEVTTKQIDISGINESLTREVEIDIPENVSIEVENKVKVNIQVEKNKTR